MTADDAQASGQAREVEVVARVIDGRTGEHMGLDNWRPLAETILRALAPLRAAERQEAAREAREGALEPMRELAAWWHRVGASEASGYDLACRDHARQIREEIDGVAGREDL